MGRERERGALSSGAVLRRRLVGRVCVLAPALAVILPLGCRKGATVKGRVIHAQKDAPVAGAQVTVQFSQYDANRNWISAGTATLVTDANGEFSTDHSDMRCRFVVNAKCDGFYPNEDFRAVRRVEHHAAHLTHTLEIYLVPVTNPRNLPRGQGEVQFQQTRRVGWSFALGRMVPEEQSDIIGEPDELGREIAFLSARGSGGLRRAVGLSGPWALFNMPKAPTDGYEPRVDLRQVGEGERTCYFVRTVDGAHYAKIDVSGPVRAHEYIGLQFYWVYQPDGSGELEIPLEQKPQ